MAITTSEFFKFCEEFDNQIKESDLATNFGMYFSVNNLEIKAYNPLKKEDGSYDFNVLGTVMVDTKFLNKSAEAISTTVTNPVTKHSEYSIKTEMLGVGDRRWYRTVVHDLKELQMAVSISNLLYINFNATVKKTDR